MSGSDYPTLSPFTTGLAGRCPRCGQGRLFAGFLALPPACAVCGLDFSPADSADGPAFFVMWAVAAVVVLCAGLVEVFFAPPLWVHAVLWLPLTLAGAALLLRPCKGIMIALQYRHRIAFDGPPGGDGERA